MPPLRRGVARRRIYEPPVIPVWVKTAPENHGITAAQPASEPPNSEQIIGDDDLLRQPGELVPDSPFLTPQELAEELLAQQNGGWEETAWPQVPSDGLPIRGGEELPRRGIAGIPLPMSTPQASRPQERLEPEAWKIPVKERSLPRWVTVGLPVAALLFALGSLYWIVGLRDQLIFEQSSIRGLTQENHKLASQVRAGTPENSTMSSQGTGLPAENLDTLPRPAGAQSRVQPRAATSGTRPSSPVAPASSVPPPESASALAPRFSWQPSVPLPYRSGALSNGSVPALATPSAGVNTQPERGSDATKAEHDGAARTLEPGTPAQGTPAQSTQAHGANAEAPASTSSARPAVSITQPAKAVEIAARTPNSRADSASHADGNSRAYGSAGPMPIAVRSTAPSPSKGPLAISSGVVAGNRISGERPVYPRIAESANVQGTVVLQATITKTGRTTNLRVVSGPIMLQRAALDAVSSWRYKPYLLNGEPVDVVTSVNVVFSLNH